MTNIRNWKACFKNLKIDNRIREKAFWCPFPLYTSVDGRKKVEPTSKRRMAKSTQQDLARSLHRCKRVNCKINKLMGGLNVDRDDNQASSNLIYLMVKVTTQVQGFRNIIFICRTLLPLLPNIQHLIFPFISRISSCHVMVRDC